MKHDITSIPAEDIREQVKKICMGPEIVNSPRLQGLLNYIVDEFLAGRGRRIKGFTIGQAIYATDESFDADSNSVVRVEMGRLRRRLTEYYLTVGRNDSIVVGIPKGSYAPRIELNPQASRVNTPSLSDNRLKSAFSTRWRIAGVLGLAILLIFSWRYFAVEEHSSSGEISQDKPEEILKGSEAQILFQQAFVLLMPPEDNTRLAASKELFQRVIEIDPRFGGGYAGKSITFSLQVLFVKSENPASDIHQALALANSAVTNDPEYGLGYAALAFAQSLNKETDSALANTRRVITIQPPDANANTIASVALIVSGKPANAIDLLSETLRLNPDKPRAPYMNLIGIAQYLNGDYFEAAKIFENNLARRGPTGPHMDIFIAATYAQLGEDFKAQAMIEKLQRTHPDYPVERWLGHYLKSEDELQATMSKLQSLGLLL